MAGTEVADGVELRAPAEGRDEELLSADALAFVAELHRRFDGTRRELLSARAERQARLDAGELPDFLARDPRDPRGRLARRAGPRRPPGPPRRDHGAGRPEDGHQRAQLGGALLHGRLRGRELAHLAEQPRRPGEPDRRDRADDRARHRREDLSPGRRPGASCSCARAAGTCPSGTCSSTASRCSGASSTSVSTSSTTAGACSTRAAGRTSTSPSSRATSRPGSGTTSSTSTEEELDLPAGLDQGDRPDRDDPRGVRDGGDPLRAARPLGRPQRRPLGLHLQHHQEVQGATRSSCSPTARR